MKIKIRRKAGVVVLAVGILAMTAGPAPAVPPWVHPTPPPSYLCQYPSDQDRPYYTTPDGIVWRCRCYQKELGSGGRWVGKCKWVIFMNPGGGTPRHFGISDFDILTMPGALSPRAYMDLHVGIMKYDDGRLQTFSDVTVLNRDNDGAEGRDPGHIALLHDVYYYNWSASQWQRCRVTDWRYSTQYHYYMEFVMEWGAPPCGSSNTYYYVTSWSAHYESGAWYVGNAWSGTTYLPSSSAALQASTADASAAPVAPAPPTAEELSKHKPAPPPPPTMNGKGNGKALNSEGVSHDGPR